MVNKKEDEAFTERPEAEPVSSWVTASPIPFKKESTSKISKVDCRTCALTASE